MKRIQWILKDLEFSRKFITLFLSGMVLFVFFMLIFGGKVQENIRNLELEQAVSSPFTDKKILLLNEKEQEKTIEESPAITVIFTQTSGKLFTQFVKLMNGKSGSINRKIYFYPKIYQVSEVNKKYNLSTDGIDILFFEKGEEKNRFSITDASMINEAVFDKMNSLQLGS